MKGRIDRPKTAAQVAEWSQSLKDFGYNLKDWAHELREVHTANAYAELVKEAPRALSDVFNEGAIADAYLAAYVVYLSGLFAIEAPRWAHNPQLVLHEPWYASGEESYRVHLRAETPSAFLAKNIYTIPDTTLIGPRPGRPAKTAEEKRQANRERQRRFREKRKKELALLREFHEGIHTYMDGS